MSQPCPVPECAGHARPGELLCPPHWFVITSKQRLAVWDTWRAIRYRPRPTTAEARSTQRAAIAQYRQARQAAIDSVTSQEAMS